MPPHRPLEEPRLLGFVQKHGVPPNIWPCLLCIVFWYSQPWDFFSVAKFRERKTHFISQFWMFWDVLRVLQCFTHPFWIFYLFRGWMSNGSETSPQSSCLKRGHLQGTHSHPMLDVRESYSLRVMRCQRSDRGNQNRRFGRNRMWFLCCRGEAVAGDPRDLWLQLKGWRDRLDCHWDGMFGHFL